MKKLSERIRPDSEAAPWVIEEIKKLEAEKELYYDLGWNSALELARTQLETKFWRAFGRDTLSSIAVYIKTLKKEINR